MLPTHLPPLPSHTQQELVTSGIIPEFAEEIVEVAEGGEMVREESGREGGREGGRKGGREGGREGGRGEGGGRREEEKEGRRREEEKEGRRER